MEGDFSTISIATAALPCNDAERLAVQDSRGARRSEAELKKLHKDMPTYMALFLKVVTEAQLRRYLEEPSRLIAKVRLIIGEGFTDEEILQLAQPEVEKKLREMQQEQQP